MAGRKTTSGEIFNPRALTAASRALPIGSVVKVTNPQNGKSVSVRINDRGPFVPGRSLDLSRRAAEKLGIIHMGVASVKVTKTSSQADISSALTREVQYGGHHSLSVDDLDIQSKFAEVRHELSVLSRGVKPRSLVRAIGPWRAADDSSVN